MAASRWMFTKEQLQNTPSRKNGIDADKELSYRQQAANLIQDMGQRLQVTQLCINTAIVFMHRFYMFRSFTRFPRNDMAPACLFLAAKVEEQPRKLEHVIKVAHSCLHRDNRPAPDTKTEAYLEQAQQLVINENILLQTLGFEVKVDHPHTHVVKATKLVNASKDLSQTSYYLATNSLHLTTFCLQHRPTVVACACIYLACKWAKYMIPRSNEGREWFQYVDQSVTMERIEELYNEFISILNKCPTKLKKLKAGSKAGDDPRDDRARPPDLGLEKNHSTSPMMHHKPHTNHDRPHSDQGKHSYTETKPSYDHRDGRPEHYRDVHPDKRKELHSSHQQQDRKPHHQDPKLGRKDDRRDGRESREGHSLSQPHRKDAQHPNEQRDRLSHHESHKREPTAVKSETDVNGRSQSSHSSTSAPNQCRSHPDLAQLEQSFESPTSGAEPLVTAAALASVSQSSTPSGTPEVPRKFKSETSAINIKEYMKRKKERDQQFEKEQREREEKKRKETEARQQRHAQEKLRKQQEAKEAELLNKTFSDSISSKEQKHRPPKLDISLPLPEQKSLITREANERPYEVNIKSPIKPHYNITVKSPIKSSDLKQPKLELPKVQITPEKDGSDPLSVNINSDPAIRKLFNIKQEPDTPGASDENNDSIRNTSQAKVKEEQFSPSDFLNVSKPDIKIKEELEPGEIEEPEINLLPEHSMAPTNKIRELGYDPEKGLDSAVSLKHVMKQEANSTPVLSGSGSNTPIRMKIPLTHVHGEGSPLKIKISTKGLSTDSDHSSGKHSSPHRHKHKHKEKHKSHKHSRDKEKHREKHRDKHSSSSSATGTNGQSLKLSIKLSGSEEWAVKHKHDKQKGSVSVPALNKNANALEPERTQPWSMSALTSVHEDSPSRKRRRTPTVDQNSEHVSHNKAQKMGSQRLRRSSSNHSVVSMEMSDGEEGQTNGPQIQTGKETQPQIQPIQQLHESLHQLISQTQKKVETLKQGRAPVGRQHRSIDRQQSGFDLEEMMWAGNTRDLPPLPAGHTALPPPLPPSQLDPPPPPSH